MLLQDIKLKKDQIDGMKENKSPLKSKKEEISKRKKQEKSLIKINEKHLF